MSEIELPPGHRLLQLNETASTNTEALRLAQTGESCGLWIAADHQTNARGRSGRTWASLPGNLQASLMIRPHCAPACVPGLALVAGIALIDAVRAIDASGSRPARLKWPNDVLFDGRKVAGVLVEGSTSGAGQIAVIGIGLNVAVAPASVGQPVTCLAAHGLGIERMAMLALLAQSMHKWLDVWADSRGFAGIREAWLARAGPRGELLSVNTGNGVSHGAFDGLDDDGALLLRDAEGVRRRYTFGDVTLAGSAAEDK